MARRLIATVYVDEVAYGPGDDVPDDVAAQITNPAAWADDDGQTAAGAPQGQFGGSRGAERAQAGYKGELEALSKADLVTLAEARGTDAGGTKAELVDRLMSPG